MGLRKPPNVFTEQDVAMLSRVINSETAIEVQHIILTTFRRILNDSERPFVNQVSFKVIWETGERRECIKRKQG